MSLTDQAVPVPNEMVRDSPGAYCLRVTGDAMKDEGILPGDVVVVKPGKQFSDGELVAITVCDEAMVRRARILPNFTTFERPGAPWGSIYEGSEGVNVIGRVIGLMRNYK